MRTATALILATCVALSIGSPPTLLAEDAGTATSTTVVERLEAAGGGERASTLIREITEGLEARGRFRHRLETASDEDALVLGAQIKKQQVEGLEGLHELADLLKELEKSAPQPDLRPAVESVFALVSPALRTFVDGVRREIDAMRAQRSKAEGGARTSLEDDIAERTDYLDEAYGLWVEHIDKRNLLGLETGPAILALRGSLASRAEELSGRLDLALKRVDEATARLDEQAGDKDLTAALLVAKKSLDTNVKSLEVTLDRMDKFEMRTESYRTQLVSATRDISTSLLDGEVTVSLVTQGVDATKKWLSEKGPQFLVKILLFLAVLFLFRLLARLVHRAAEKSLRSSRLNVSKLLERMIINTATNLVMFIGVLVALSQLGISLGPLMAGLGVAGFIVGFALQDTLSNFASGMMILLYRPYDVGDLIEVAGAFGKVDRMSLVSTSILTLDHQTLVVPNNKVWGDVIKNVTAQKIRRVDMVFGISYSDDIPKAEKILESILDKNERILDEPTPMVRLHELADSSVNFVVRPWAETDDYWDVYWDVTREVKMRFDAEGVSIPFPQRDVHLFQESAAAPD